MRITRPTKPILVRSRPRLTTTLDLQGASGIWAAVGRRRRGGGRVRRQKGKRKRRLGLSGGTLNDGTMTGKAGGGGKWILCVFRRAGGEGVELKEQS